jgi:hypothetical protein
VNGAAQGTRYESRARGATRRPARSPRARLDGDHQLSEPGSAAAELRDGAVRGCELAAGGAP